MAIDKKISELANGAPAQAGDEYVVARSGSNYKLTLTNIAATMPPIGASTPNSGAFTTLSASSTVSGTGFSTYLASPPAIGGTAAAAGSFTTLSASGVTTVQAGTSALPAVTTTGDTNTGAYFPAADEMAITTGGTVAAAFNSNGLFFRNRIINGDMRIDQRNAGASTTSSGYTLDRWIVVYGTGTLTSQQSTTVIPTGFTQSYGVTVTSVGTRLATDYFFATQLIEGLNVSDLGFGAAGASTVTLSFWVRSSVTGLYSGVLASGDNNRSYGFTYSISVANTWEKKTITISGDTSGGTTAYPVGTGTGMRLKLDLGSGSNYQTTVDTWAANANRAGVAGTVGWAQTAGATFYFTGVQLETGSVATPFESRPYGTELMLCQRYYAKFGQASGDGTAGLVTNAGICTSTTRCDMSQSLPVTMRTVPTSLEWGNLKLQETDNNQPVPSALSLDTTVSTSTYVSYNTTHTGGTADRGARMLKNTSAGYIAFSAEL